VGGKLKQELQKIENIFFKSGPTKIFVEIFLHEKIDKSAWPLKEGGVVWH
jgi:hypothetical protein